MKKITAKNDLKRAIKLKKPKTVGEMSIIQNIIAKKHKVKVEDIL